MVEREMGGEGIKWGVKQKRSGWKAAGAKEVSSGLWNQELIVVLYTATTLHQPSLKLQHLSHALYPHNLCSTSVQLECRLSAPTHPFKFIATQGKKKKMQLLSPKLQQYVASLLPVNVKYS